MDNPEKLATYGTQGEEKLIKNTTQWANRDQLFCIWWMLFQKRVVCNDISVFNAPLLTGPY